MDLLKTYYKISAAFGNIRAMEKLHVDSFTENKIKNISGNKIAASEEGQFWINFQELNGYLFMNSTILSKFKLKSNKGAKIKLYSDDSEIEIKSDDIEIDSDFSNVSNTWMTKLCFILNDEEREIIENKKFNKLEYHFKKRVLVFYKFN